MINNMNRQNKKTLLLVAAMSIMIILYGTLISAADSPTIQKLPQEVTQGQSIDLPQGGSNGSAAWVYCNITRIIDPDHNILLSDLVMTKNGYSFNYTLNGAYTQDIGSYTVETICGDGVNVKSGIYSFEVTTTGGSTGNSLWMALLLMGVSLIFFIVSLYADNQYIGFITGISFVVSGMYVMIYGFGGLADLYTRTIAMILIAFGFIVLFISAFHEHGDKNGLADYFSTKKSEYDEYDHFTRNDD